MEIGKHSGGGTGSQSVGRRRSPSLPQGYNINSEGARSPFTRKGDFLWRVGSRRQTQQWWKRKDEPDCRSLCSSGVTFLEGGPFHLKALVHFSFFRDLDTGPDSIKA